MYQKSRSIHRITLSRLGFAVTVAMASSAASAGVLFSDDFNRDTGNSIGSGWSVVERHNSDVAIADRPGVGGIDNVLRLRDDASGSPDAAAGRAGASGGISTLGYQSIQLSYEWAPLTDSEHQDLLYSGWRVGDSGSWNILGSHALGGSGGFSSQSFELSGADDLESISIRFWTDIDDGSGCAWSLGWLCLDWQSDSTDREGALIDNVQVTGTTIPEAAIVAEPDLAPAAVPLPGTVALLGVAAFAMGALRRRRG